MTTPTQTPSFEARLQRLESQLTNTRRSLKRTRLLLAAGGIAALGLLTAAVADLAVIDVLRTQRLEIIDDDGHIVLAAASDHGGGRIDLWTPDGCNFMRLTSNEQGGDLALWNCEGKSVAGLYATGSGGELSIWDSKGSRSARMHPGDSGGTVELMHDEQLRATLKATMSGSALELQDNQGHTMVNASTSEQYGSLGLGQHLLMSGNQERSELTLKGTNQQDLVTLRGTARNDGLLLLQGSNGEVRLQTGEGDLLPKATLSNRDGKIAAHMSVRDHGGGTLTASAADGTEVASIRSDAKDNGRVDVSGQGGTLLATIQAMQGRGATLALMAPNQKTACAMAASEHGGVINLSNGQGTPVLVGGIASGRRDGAISIFNQRGIPVVSAGGTVGGFGQLVLNDDNGHRVVALPERYTASEAPSGTE